MSTVVLPKSIAPAPDVTPGYCDVSPEVGVDRGVAAELDATRPTASVSCADTLTADEPNVVAKPLTGVRPAAPPDLDKAKSAKCRLQFAERALRADAKALSEFDITDAALARWRDLGECPPGYNAMLRLYTEPAGGGRSNEGHPLYRALLNLGAIGSAAAEYRVAMGLISGSQASAEKRRYADHKCQAYRKHSDLEEAGVRTLGLLAARSRSAREAIEKRALAPDATVAEQKRVLVLRQVELESQRKYQVSAETTMANLGGEKRVSSRLRRLAGHANARNAEAAVDVAQSKIELQTSIERADPRLSPPSETYEAMACAARAKLLVPNWQRDDEVLSYLRHAEGDARVVLRQAESAQKTRQQESAAVDPALEQSMARLGVEVTRLNSAYDATLDATIAQRQQQWKEGDLSDGAYAAEMAVLGREAREVKHARELDILHAMWTLAQQDHDATRLRQHAQAKQQGAQRQQELEQELAGQRNALKAAEAQALTMGRYSGGPVQVEEARQLSARDAYVRVHELRRSIAVLEARLPWVAQGADGYAVEMQMFAEQEQDAIKSGDAVAASDYALQRERALVVRDAASSEFASLEVLEKRVASAATPVETRASVARGAASGDMGTDDLSLQLAVLQGRDAELAHAYQRRGRLTLKALETAHVIGVSAGLDKLKGDAKRQRRLAVGEVELDYARHRLESAQAGRQIALLQFDARQLSDAAYQRHSLDTTSDCERKQEALRDRRAQERHTLARDYGYTEADDFRLAMERFAGLEREYRHDWHDPSMRSHVALHVGLVSADAGVRLMDELPKSTLQFFTYGLDAASYIVASRRAQFGRTLGALVQGAFSDFVARQHDNVGVAAHTEKLYATVGSIVRLPGVAEADRESYARLGGAGRQELGQIEALAYDELDQGAAYAKARARTAVRAQYDTETDGMGDWGGVFARIHRWATEDNNLARVAAHIDAETARFRQANRETFAVFRQMREGQALQYLVTLRSGSTAQDQAWQAAALCDLGVIDGNQARRVWHATMASRLVTEGLDTEAASEKTLAAMRARRVIDGEALSTFVPGAAPFANQVVARAEQERETVAARISDPLYQGAISAFDKAWLVLLLLMRGAPKVPGAVPNRATSLARVLGSRARLVGEGSRVGGALLRTGAKVAEKVATGVRAASTASQALDNAVALDTALVQRHIGWRLLDLAGRTVYGVSKGTLVDRGVQAIDGVAAEALDKKGVALGLFHLGRDVWLYTNGHFVPGMRLVEDVATTAAEKVVDQVMLPEIFDTPGELEHARQNLGRLRLWAQSLYGSSRQQRGAQTRVSSLAPVRVLGDDIARTYGSRLPNARAAQALAKTVDETESQPLSVARIGAHVGKIERLTQQADVPAERAHELAVAEANRLVNRLAAQAEPGSDLSDVAAARRYLDTVRQSVEELPLSAHDKLSLTKQAEAGCLAQTTLARLDVAGISHDSAQAERVLVDTEAALGINRGLGISPANDTTSGPTTAHVAKVYDFSEARAARQATASGNDSEPATAAKPAVVTKLSISGDEAGVPATEAGQHSTPRQTRGAKDDESDSSRRRGPKTSVSPPPTVIDPSRRDRPSPTRLRPAPPVRPEPVFGPRAQTPSPSRRIYLPPPPTTLVVGQHVAYIRTLQQAQQQLPGMSDSHVWEAHPAGGAPTAHTPGNILYRDVWHRMASIRDGLAWLQRTGALTATDHVALQARAAVRGDLADIRQRLRQIADPHAGVPAARRGRVLSPAAGKSEREALHGYDLTLAAYQAVTATSAGRVGHEQSCAAWLAACDRIDALMPAATSGAAPTEAPVTVPRPQPAAAPEHGPSPHVPGVPTQPSMGVVAPSPIAGELQPAVRQPTLPPSQPPVPHHPTLVSAVAVVPSKHSTVPPNAPSVPPGNPHTRGDTLPSLPRPPEMTRIREPGRVRNLNRAEWSTPATQVPSAHVKPSPPPKASPLTVVSVTSGRSAADLRLDPLLTENLNLSSLGAYDEAHLPALLVAAREVHGRLPNDATLRQEIIRDLARGEPGRLDVATRALRDGLPVAMIRDADIPTLQSLDRAVLLINGIGAQNLPVDRIKELKLAVGVERWFGGPGYGKGVRHWLEQRGVPAERLRHDDVKLAGDGEHSSSASPEKK